jgi:dTDP-4-amino-4,6-dideoxy-D-galactose acyltransferase
VVIHADAASSCELLEWDTAFFGVRIGRVRGHRLTNDQAAAALDWASREAIACLYLLADADHHETIRAAARHAFALTDMRFELAAPIATDDLEPVPATIRRAQQSDGARLTALARTSHRNTRFYADPHFNRARCDDLYALWLERSLSGELADVVFTSDVDGMAVGYAAVRQTSPETGQIGLIAVDSAQRGGGHGAALMAAAKQWCADRGIRRLRVVTQGGNAAAIRFYERAGFTAEAVRLWYHHWSSAASD